MSRSIVLLALLVVTTLADTASADGLIYQLPEDGTGVTYDMEIKQTVRGRENTTNGTLTIKSVGETILGGENCRWIECKMVTRLGRFDQVVISKTLIPEKQLGKGEKAVYRNALARARAIAARTHRAGGRVILRPPAQCSRGATAMSYLLLEETSNKIWRMYQNKVAIAANRPSAAATCWSVR